ncbi:MAG: 1-deoxy-D-xylulose-5-phosphate reductoisomerase [Planctomycetia bacterium]|nr:1-deoxy-D-xylulose-5-phosphate reductoisomerase [Planctomycetia bacterium]
MKRIALFGSTGSIGRSTFDVVEAYPELFRVDAISGHRNLHLLKAQAEKYRPKWVIVSDDQSARLIQREIPSSCEICVGREGFNRVASHESIDIVVSAIVGVAGLECALTTVRNGKRLALANKESLVAAGALVKETAKQNQAEIVPVDSEHSAIFQALQAGKRTELERVILTASGGPFLRWRDEDLKNVSLQDALKHPTWNMGAKITIDSATLMNKALEIIEARWLFDLAEGELVVMIHPQSVVHSMVEFRDGAVLAQWSPPDMRLPIQYALTYPERLGGGPTRRSDWRQAWALEFLPPDDSPRFDALRLGFEVAWRGGSAGVALNAANEVAVQAFVEGRIRFDQIVPFVRKTVEEHAFLPSPTLEEILAIDREIRARGVALKPMPPEGRTKWCARSVRKPFKRE